MDNANVGENSGNFAGNRDTFGAPESFEKAFEIEDRTEASRGLGEAATSSVMREILGEQGENREKFDLPDVPEMMPAPETKPLIADGTTERKMGKIGVSLVGEKVDSEGIEKEANRIKKLPLYEQSAALNLSMAQMLRANFGRMIGNDDIGEIQAEEKKRAVEAEQGRAA